MRTIDDIKSGMETAVILGDLPYALNRIDEAYRLGKQALCKKPLQDRIDRAVEVLENAAARAQKMYALIGKPTDEEVAFYQAIKILEGEA